MVFFLKQIEPYKRVQWATMVPHVKVPSGPSHTPSKSDLGIIWNQITLFAVGISIPQIPSPPSRHSGVSILCLQQPNYVSFGETITVPRLYSLSYYAMYSHALVVCSDSWASRITRAPVIFCSLPTLLAYIWQLNIHSPKYFPFITVHHTTLEICLKGF